MGAAGPQLLKSYQLLQFLANLSTSFGHGIQGVPENWRAQGVGSGMVGMRTEAAGLAGLFKSWYDKK